MKDKTVSDVGYVHRRHRTRKIKHYKKPPNVKAYKRKKWEYSNQDREN